MADRVQAEIIQESLTSGMEVVRESDGDTQMVDVDDAMADYIAAKRDQHPEWYVDSEEPLETTDAETKQSKTETAGSAEDEQAGSEDPEFVTKAEEEEQAEPQSKALKRILTREAKLRDDKAAFEQEQKEFKDKLAQFEEAQKLATLDPVGYLKAIGIPQERLIDIAKAAYYESLGDSAPDEYKGQKESLALRREIEQLKQRLEAKDAAPEDNGVQEAIAAYQDSMVEAVKTFDTDQFPSVARVVDAYSEQDVAADMFAIAQSYAEQMGGRGAPLTPEQCMVEVEKHYAQLLGKLAPAPMTQAEPAAQKKASKAAKKTLSNSMSSNVPPEKPLEDLSYEELRAHARANFDKFMAANKGD